jgi:hypothetical protein
MNFAAFERAQAAAFAYREGRHTGSLACLRAILFILRNRVKSGWGGGSWLAAMASDYMVSASFVPFVFGQVGTVVNWGPKDFLNETRSDDESGYGTSKPGPEEPVLVSNFKSDDRLLQMIVREVDDIYLGQEPWDDAVRQVVCGEGAASFKKDWNPVLYYSFVDRPPRPWFVENIIQKPAEHPQVGQVGGKMMLYR